MNDAAQEAPNFPEGSPQGLSQPRSGNSVTDVDGEASPRQTVPDNPSIFVSESENSSNIPTTTVPGMGDFEQAQEWSDESSPRGAQKVASSSEQQTKHDEARHNERYFKGKTPGDGEDARFDE